MRWCAHNLLQLRARATMGRWGDPPHTPGMAGHCLVTLGGHTHTTTTTFGAPDTVFDGSNCAVRVSFSGVRTIFSIVGSTWCTEAVTPHISVAEHSLATLVDLTHPTMWPRP